MTQNEAYSHLGVPPSATTEEVISSFEDKYFPILVNLLFRGTRFPTEEIARFWSDLKILETAIKITLPEYSIPLNLSTYKDSIHTYDRAQEQNELPLSSKSNFEKKHRNGFVGYWVTATIVLASCLSFFVINFFSHRELLDANTSKIETFQSDSVKYVQSLGTYSQLFPDNTDLIIRNNYSEDIEVVWFGCYYWASSDKDKLEHFFISDVQYKPIPIIKGATVKLRDYTPVGNWNGKYLFVSFRIGVPKSRLTANYLGINTDFEKGIIVIQQDSKLKRK